MTLNLTWYLRVRHNHTVLYRLLKAEREVRAMVETNGVKRWEGVIDLFAGAGGLTWGWDSAGFRIDAAVEIDPAAALTHDLNFSSTGCRSLNADLTRFSPEDLERTLGGRPADLLAITGGPPCQGWSHVGRGKLRSLQSRAESLLDDPRNSLYRQFLRFVEYFHPPVCVMENVPGMLNLEGRNVAEEVAENFERIGYTATYALVNARWFGVPQDRRRLIFICTHHRSGLDLDAKELEEFGPYFRTEIADLTTDETTLQRALQDLPEVSHGCREESQQYHRRPGRISRYAAFMRRGCNGRVADHVCRRHNEMDLEAFSLMPQGGLYVDLPVRLQRYRTDIFPDKYRRLRWNGVSGTITAHLAKDCYQHIHPIQDRTISIREAARIQSFPDSFRFHGNMGDRYRQIGNAVPPLMGWGIAEYIRLAVEALTG